MSIDNGDIILLAQEESSLHMLPGSLLCFALVLFGSLACLMGPLTFKVQLHSSFTFGLHCCLLYLPSKETYASPTMHLVNHLGTSLSIIKSPRLIIADASI